jgi:hypothetical protein
LQLQDRRRDGEDETDPPADLAAPADEGIDSETRPDFAGVVEADIDPDFADVEEAVEGHKRDKLTMQNFHAY